MGKTTDKAKAKIKRAAGALTGKKKLEREGKMDEVKGAAKGAAEDVEHAVEK